MFGTFVVSFLLGESQYSRRIVHKYNRCRRVWSARVHRAAQLRSYRSTKIVDGWSDGIEGRQYDRVLSFIRNICKDMLVCVFIMVPVENFANYVPVAAAYEEAYQTSARMN